MILLHFLGEFYSLSISHKQSSIMCGCQLIYLVKFFFVIKQLGYTDTPFLVTYWCPTCVRHGYRYDSSDSSVRAESFFFHFFDAAPTRLRQGGHANSEKKKSQILTDGQIITIDFVMYPKTKKLTSLRSHYRES